MTAAAALSTREHFDPRRGCVVTPRQRSLERLEAQITELWGHINAASYRFLELVAEFDRLGGHEEHGLVSCAQWLNWQCGIGTVAAREKVRVARALESLPKISEAFRRGVISYSKVREITRVATPEDEHVLLNTALYGTAAHVERHVRKFRWCQRRDEAREANERHRRRFLSCFHDEDGSVVVHAVLPPEIGALVRKALEAAVEEVDENETQSNVPAEASEETQTLPTRHSPVGTKQADALRRLAESYLEQRNARRGGVDEKFQVVVHIDQRLLSRSPVHGGPPTQDGDRVGGDGGVLAGARSGARAARTGPGADAPDSAALDRDVLDHDVRRRCELEDADRPLAIETARRLACDATLVGIVDGPLGDPLSVGRRTRAISPALKRALKVRDGGCLFPGCTRTRFTEGHHVVHWAEGGETKLDNLATLCGFHHRLVHEGGYGLHALASGAAGVRFVFTRPDGSVVEPNGRYQFCQVACAGAEPVVPAAARSPADDPSTAGPSAAASPAAAPRQPMLFELNRTQGLAIDAETSRCGWRGETMCYSTAIEAQQDCRRDAAHSKAFT